MFFHRIISFFYFILFGRIGNGEYFYLIYTILLVKKNYIKSKYLFEGISGHFLYKIIFNIDKILAAKSCWVHDAERC